MRKSRVCCCLERWESGGIESFLHNVIMLSDMSRLEIDIVATEIKDSVFTADLKDKGVRFVELSGEKQKLRRNHKKFRELLVDRHYDVVHLNAYQGLSLYYLRLAQKAGVPVRIAHSHNTDLRKSLGRSIKLSIHKWAKNKWTGAATCLWACSAQAAEFLFQEDLLKEHGFTFIPNGIDTERFRFDPIVRKQTREELGVNDKFVIGNIGRLCYQKNQELLLDILAEALKKNAETVLLLVGDGEDKESLKTKAKSLGVEDKVIFYGTSNKTQRLYWAMDAFVLPSRFEGLPVTAVEAQAAGLQCYFSDAITAQCKISASTVFMSAALPPEDWAKAILKSAPDADRAQAADKAKAAGFDIADAAKQVESSYLRSDIDG